MKSVRIVLYTVAGMVSILAAAAVLGLLGIDPPGGPPPPGRWVEISPGVRVNVIDEGTGPPLVLVHGCPGSAYDWSPLSERLVSSGYRVVRYDRIGYGHSDRRDRDEGHSFQQNAQELIGLIEALDLDRLILLGWSYGGGIAQIVARQVPDRIVALVLVSSAGPLHERRGWDFLERLLFATEDLTRWSIAAGWGRSTIERMGETTFSGRMPEWWPEHTLAMLALPGAVHTWITEIKLREVGTLVGPDLEMPSLILHGTADGMSDYATAEDLHRRLSRSTLVAVEGGSHMLPNTHADLLVDRMGEWGRTVLGGRPLTR